MFPFSTILTPTQTTTTCTPVSIHTFIYLSLLKYVLSPVIYELFVFTVSLLSMRSEVRTQTNIFKHLRYIS